jgi:hypothetical protein
MLSPHLPPPLHTLTHTPQGAVMEVDVEDSMREDIKNNLHQDPDKQVFVHLQEIVFGQIEEDEFMRFLPSIHWYLPYLPY